MCSNPSHKDRPGIGLLLVWSLKLKKKWDRGPVQVLNKKDRKLTNLFFYKFND
jgi:hypothetical protein